MTPLQALSFTDRDLIEKIIENYFIMDYGFITEINPDETINVIHAKKGVSLEGKVLPETETKNVELLTFSCAEFSVKLTPKKGDNVLLLGLRNYVEHAAGITTATKNEVFLHYQQNTMKAVPLSLFSDEAKVKFEINEGDLTISTTGNVVINADGDTEINCNQADIKCSGFAVKNSSGTAALEVTP